MKQYITNKFVTENILIFLFFIWQIGAVCYGEHIPAGNGLGWDGVQYSDLAQHFYTLVFGHQLSEYTVQRILPSGIIYAVGKLFHLPLSNENMPFIFGMYNTVLLAFGVCLWKAIATKQHWSAQIRLISFSGLFLNFAVLKMSGYYSVLTDISAFVCGLLLLFLFLSNKNISLLIVSVLGAFIFPTLLCMGLIFFIFPYTKDNDDLVNDKNNLKASRWSAWIATACIVGLALIFQHTVINKDSSALGRYLWLPVLCVSVFTLMIYLYFGFRPFFDNFSRSFHKLKQLVHVRILLAFFVFIAMKTLIHFLSNGAPGALTSWLFLQVLLVRALAYPLIFLISYVLYYGPIVFLLIYFWKDIVNHSKMNGFGLLTLLFLYLILSINSESRQLINFLPIAVFTVSEMINQKILPPYFTAFFVGLSLLMSRFYFPLNHGEWPSLYTNPPQITLEFPMQWYFMSQGPWMSHTPYMTFFILIGLTFFFVYQFLRNESVRS